MEVAHIDKMAKSLQDALGLGDKRIRSIGLHIHLTVDEIAIGRVIYEEFLDDGTVKKVAKTIELAEWNESHHSEVPA